MKKINISEVGMPQIRLELIHRQKIIKSWQGLVLRGSYWRLYWNSTPGAGVFLDGARMEFQPDFLYLLPPGCKLKTWCRNPEAEQFYIHFEAMQYGGSHEVLCSEIRMNPVRRRLLKQIIDSLAVPEEDWKRGLWALALVADVLTALPPKVLNERNVEQNFMNVCSYMRTHFKENLCLEHLAAQVNMAPNAFVRKFRECYQTTPYQYLLHLRYVHAARLLMSRRMALKEVASAVGVNDCFQFSRGFKAVYGVSPAVFRKRQNEAAGDAAVRP